MGVEIDGKTYSWTQAVCTNCWVQRNSVPDNDGGALVRQPVLVKWDATEAVPWMDRLHQCCHCGGATTSGIFVREDPRTVNHPRQEDE